MIFSYDNNELYASIEKIQNVDNLNIVTFSFLEQKLSMMSLGLNNTKVGQNVILSVNASHIAIAKDVEKLNEILSYSNQIKCTIIELEVGQLLCFIKLKIQDTILESLITSASAKKLDLKINDTVIALIKASELSIKEVL